MTDSQNAGPDTERWRSLQAALTRKGERRLVLLESECEGGREQALHWLRAVLPALSLESGAWVGPAEQCPDSRLTTITPGIIRRWLGRELAVVVWDGWSGNPPDALAALSGTLKAGGLLFWLMPPVSQWHAFKDPDYQRTGLNHGGEHPFARRMAQVIAGDASVVRVSFSADIRAGRTTALTTAFPADAESEPGFRVQTTAGQQALVKRLVHFGLGRRRRPVVITADRGRGKSAALGMAAAELLKQGRRQILITAPFEDNTATLFQHAKQALGAELHKATETALETRAGGCLRFLPVRELLAEKPEAEVVMVDEAAAIPAFLLKQVLLGWPRVAFSSTVHGYEGSGRGFAIRFRQILDRETPHWQGITLTEPVRWAPADPLEGLVSRLFLLAAEEHAMSCEGVNGKEAAPLHLPESGQLIIEPWHPAQATDAKLAGSFGLLINAHYRTSPADLRQWLDDPAAITWRASVDGQTLGILWAATEGGLSAELAEQVTLGKRRVRGHLLPQSLAAHSGFPAAARQRCLRIVRIAVAEGARRQGIGRQLVRAASDYAEASGLDTLGTSYGGNQDLLAFWQGCGLKLVRIGLQQEATSGEYPLQMLQARSPVGARLVQQAQARLADHWLTLIPVAWPALEPALLAELTQALPAPMALNDDDRRDLHSFGCGHRGLLLSLPVLQRLSQIAGVMGWLREQGDAGLWCAAVLQVRSWSGLQRLGLCLGQREGEDALRRMVRELLNNGPEL
jgi:tRNA(Met) cytidine acetyltransferase